MKVRKVCGIKFGSKKLQMKNDKSKVRQISHKEGKMGKNCGLKKIQK
jgi:hypothetical protein